MAQVNGNIAPLSSLGPQTAGVWGDSRDQFGVVGTSHARDGVRESVIEGQGSSERATSGLG
jgi:hypothetical protein